MYFTVIRILSVLVAAVQALLKAGVVSLGQDAHDHHDALGEAMESLRSVDLPVEQGSGSRMSPEEVEKLVREMFAREAANQPKALTADDVTQIATDLIAKNALKSLEHAPKVAEQQ